jgi:hypothetical protein
MTWFTPGLPSADGQVQPDSPPVEPHDDEHEVVAAETQYLRLKSWL